MANDKSPSPQDLNALIEQAQTSVSGKRATAQARVEHATAAARRPSVVGPVLKIALLLAAAYAVFTIWQAFAPPSPGKVEHDLDMAINAAHDVIEKTKADTGDLPDALPNAALAAVVRYEPEPTKVGYTLSATIMGIRVTLEPSGRKRVENVE